MAGREFDPAVARRGSAEPWLRVGRGARRVGTAFVAAAAVGIVVATVLLLVQYSPDVAVSRAVSAAGGSASALSGADLLVHVAVLAGLAGTWCWGLALVLAGLFER